MYEVGEYVVHPGQGVCLVEEVTTGPDPRYRLMPVGQRHPMSIIFPVKGEDRLRPVLSAEEARSIIEEYPTMEVGDCPSRGSDLEERRIKEEIRSGSCEDSVRIAKTFRKRIAADKARNKKPPVVYVRILKEASERSLEELAVALGLTPDEVWELFQNRLAEEGDRNN